MTRHDDVTAAVRGFVTETFLYARPGVVIAPDDPLLGVGIVDSMGVMELVAWLEETFGVYVEDDELTEENLGTLAAVARLVERKRRGRSAA